MRVEFSLAGERHQQQWGYDPNGELKAVPLKSGAGSGAGYDDTFCMADHGLKQLRVETCNGLVFATFSDKTPHVWFVSLDHEG